MQFFAFFLLSVEGSPARNRRRTTENPAPKPVARALTEAEIKESNARIAGKLGKNFRNKSRLDAESKVEVLKINTLDRESTKMSKF